MLREYVGDYPFFLGLDQLAQERDGQRVTTDQLQRALEETSGVSLDEFFDYWVHGGFIPNIEVDYQIDERNGQTTLFGCVTTDVPFGSFDLPIQVSDRDGERVVAALVDVDDGIGAFEVPARFGKVEIEVDPLGMVLAYGRKAREVKRTSCEIAK